jgi:hypothetical protein
MTLNTSHQGLNDSKSLSAKSQQIATLTAAIDWLKAIGIVFVVAHHFSRSLWLYGCHTADSFFDAHTFSTDGNRPVIDPNPKNLTGDDASLITR